MTDDLLPYARQWIDEDDVAAVASQLRDEWLTQGPRVAAFEEALAEVTRAKYAVAVSSGTAALHLAAIAAGVEPGSVGITSAITFVASANCIAYGSGIPVFADVDPATGLIDVKDLARRCETLAAESRPPRVVIPVDFAGQPADLPAVRRIADRYAAVVIEDAAHALGATYEHEGRRVKCGSCTHTELAVLSFHPVKHITTGEGGAILTNDGALCTKLRELRSHGITREPDQLGRHDGPWYYEQQDLGFNYRITAFQAALGISQLKRLGHFLQRRRELARRYDELLAEPPFVGRLVPLANRKGVSNAYHLYVVSLLPGPGETLESVAARRLALYEHLLAGGIRPQVHYIPVPRQPWYAKQLRGSESLFPGADQYYAACLSLPLFPAMCESDVDRVVERLRSHLEAA